MVLATVEKRSIGRVRETVRTQRVQIPTILEVSGYLGHLECWVSGSSGPTKI